MYRSSTIAITCLTMIFPSSSEVLVVPAHRVAQAAIVGGEMRTRKKNKVKNKVQILIHYFSHFLKLKKLNNMKKSKFSLDDVNIIHTDVLEENGMSEIIGGISSSATECTCDCFISNKNKETKEQDSTASLSREF